MWMKSAEHAKKNWLKKTGRLCPEWPMINQFVIFWCLREGNDLQLFQVLNSCARKWRTVHNSKLRECKLGASTLAEQHASTIIFIKEKPNCLRGIWPKHHFMAGIWNWEVAQDSLEWPVLCWEPRCHWFGAGCSWEAGQWKPLENYRRDVWEANPKLRHRHVDMDRCRCGV